MDWQQLQEKIPEDTWYKVIIQDEYGRKTIGDAVSKQDVLNQIKANGPYLKSDGWATYTVNGKTYKLGGGKIIVEPAHGKKIILHVWDLPASMPAKYNPPPEETRTYQVTFTDKEGNKVTYNALNKQKALQIAEKYSKVYKNSKITLKTPDNIQHDKVANTQAKQTQKIQNQNTDQLTNLSLDGALYRAATESKTKNKEVEIYYPKFTPPEANPPSADEIFNKRIILGKIDNIQISKNTYIPKDETLDETQSEINRQNLNEDYTVLKRIKSKEDEIVRKLKLALIPIEQNNLEVAYTGEFAAGLALGAIDFFRGMGKLAVDTISSPQKGLTDVIEGITSLPEQASKAAKAAAEGNTIPAGRLTGQLLTGAVVEGGLEAAGVKTTASIAHDVLSGPAGKINTLFDPLRPGYKPELSDEINMVPSSTFEPRPVEHYVKKFAGKENTLIHMTSSDVFTKAKTGEEILLKGNPEAASGFRKAFDLLHWYQSLPTDEGKPNAYLGYVGIGAGESEKVEFRLFPSKKEGVVTKDVVEYIPPKEGESLAEYSRRTGRLSGKTLIPAENVFDKSVERQVITPASFEGRFDEYPGTYVRKVRDLGWTRYQENRLPEEIKDTKVGKAVLEKLGFGQKYHKIEFSEWGKIPVESETTEEPTETGIKPSKEVDLVKYNEDYTKTKEITLSESAEKAVFDLSKNPSLSEQSSKQSVGFSSRKEKSSGSIIRISREFWSSQRKQKSKPSRPDWSKRSSIPDFSEPFRLSKKSKSSGSRGRSNWSFSSGGSGGSGVSGTSGTSGGEKKGTSSNGRRVAETTISLSKPKAETIAYPMLSKNRKKKKEKPKKLKDWLIQTYITPKADWWAMTYTQAVVGIKANSPLRFDAEKQWKQDLTKYGFGLTFPTRFIERHGIKSYLDVTIRKAGELDIVTGKRAKKKINKSKKLKITGKDTAKVGFGSGKQINKVMI